MACPGHVVVTGIGKPSFIAQKLSATLASTGIPSLFLHPAEAVHGDLGRVKKSDVVLALSNSGATEEILRLLPALKHTAPGLSHALRAGGRSATASRDRHRTRNVLIVTQVAFALMLLVSSGLMLRTSLALRAVEPGFTDPASLQTVRISIPATTAASSRRPNRLARWTPSPNAPGRQLGPARF